MTYEELKKAYEMAMQKCSELESEKAELEKKNSDLKRESEDKDLRIERKRQPIPPITKTEPGDPALTFNV